MLCGKERLLVEIVEDGYFKSMTLDEAYEFVKQGKTINVQIYNIWKKAKLTLVDKDSLSKSRKIFCKIKIAMTNVIHYLEKNIDLPSCFESGNLLFVKSQRITKNTPILFNPTTIWLKRRDIARCYAGSVEKINIDDIDDNFYNLEVTDVGKLYLDNSYVELADGFLIKSDGIFEDKEMTA